MLMYGALFNSHKFHTAGTDYHICATENLLTKTLLMSHALIAHPKKSMITWHRCATGAPSGTAGNQ